MNPMVEFCISNLANGSQATYEVLERDQTSTFWNMVCLSYCTKCSESFYAIVNGELVEADSPDELTKAIYQFIEENPLW